MKSTLSYVAAIVITLHTSFCSGLSAAEMQKVEGTVVDAENRPVRDVWIRVYRGATEIAKGMVDENGRYSIEFEPGAPIIVRYDHLHTDAFKRFHPCVVSSISGANDQRIYPVFATRVGTGIDQQPLLDVLAAYERLYAIDAAVPDLAGMRLQVHQRYAQDVGMIKGVDELTKERHQKVRELYNKELGSR